MQPDQRGSFAQQGEIRESKQLVWNGATQAVLMQFPAIARTQPTLAVLRASIRQISRRGGHHARAEVRTALAALSVKRAPPGWCRSGDFG